MQHHNQPEMSTNIEKYWSPAEIQHIVSPLFVKMHRMISLDNMICLQNNKQFNKSEV